jgi:hypothetical protein
VVDHVVAFLANIERMGYSCCNLHKQAMENDTAVFEVSQWGSRKVEAQEQIAGI